MIERIPESRRRFVSTRLPGNRWTQLRARGPSNWDGAVRLDMCEASVTDPAASADAPSDCLLPSAPSALIECRRLTNCSHIAWLVRLETAPRYQQNCTECHKEKARPIRSEPQESQAAPWRLQSIASGPGGIPATKRSPPNSGACHVQDSADNEERAKSHQEHSRLSICRCPAQYNWTQASGLENVPAKRSNSTGRCPT
jgi:hypothetical protein